MKKGLLSIMLMALAIAIPTKIWAQESYAVLSDNNTVLTFYFDDQKDARNGMEVYPNGENEEKEWHEFGESITKVVFDDSFADCTTITNTAKWFFRCTKLTTIEGLANLNTSNVNNMYAMFRECSSITNLDLSHFDTSNVTEMTDMFSGCSSLVSVNVSSFNTSKVNSIRWMFYECSSLINLDLSNFNTSSVTDMEAVFVGCISLTSLDVSHFDTSNVTVMRGMFEGCSALTSLDVSNFNTSKVEDMDAMFDGCSSLTSLDVSHFNTENVTVMDYMFNDCSSLTSLDVSHFNTENVVRMDKMFGNCSSLTSLDVSHFKTANVTYTGWMFYGCSGLTSIDVSNFNTEKVTDMGAMFYDCTGLTSLDLSHFSTSNVSTFEWMFVNCSNLTSLDLSSFNTAKVENTGGMFNHCINLRTIFVDEAWTTANMSRTDNMFTDCMNLVGGKGTHYDGNHTDASYAHIDGGTGNPGYFTRSGDEPWSGGEPYALLSKSTKNLLSRTWHINAAEQGHLGSGEPGSDGQTWWSAAPFEKADWGVYDDSITFNKNYSYTYNPGAGGTVYVNHESTLFPEYNTQKDADGNLVDFMAPVEAQRASYYFIVDKGKLKLGLSNNTLFPYLSSDEQYKNPTFTIASLTDSTMVLLYEGKDITWRFMFVSDDGESAPDVLTFYYDENKEERNGMSVGPFESEGGKGINSEWNNYRHSIESVVFSDSFADCTTLTSTAYWFYQLDHLTSVSGLENLKTGNVTDINSMFTDCESLTDIDLSILDFRNVRNMKQVFEGCTNLQSVGLNGLNTENVTNMGDLFLNCSSLRIVDLGSFNTSKVTNMSHMFYRCESLVTVLVSEGWTTANVTDSEKMFERCTSLVGSEGTRFDENHIDAAYAHIDEGTNNPGYFTDKETYESLRISLIEELEKTEAMLMYAEEMLARKDPNRQAAELWDMCMMLKAETKDVEYKIAEAVSMDELRYCAAEIDKIRLMLDELMYRIEEYSVVTARFDGLTAWVSGDVPLDEAFMETGGREAAAQTIAAIVWGNSFALTADMLQGISNPNLLVYVTDASLAPEGVQNVVVNGQAQEIILTDATTGNNNFYCPEPFRAQRISYTRNFQQHTVIGTSRGWEGLTLPFPVQTITHATQGQITPFRNDGSNKHFWLRRMTDNGLTYAQTIEPNVPYLIAMPNSTEYYDEFNLSGRVTFSAENTEVYSSENKQQVGTNEIILIPTFTRVAASDDVYALNVGNARDGYAEGSVFIRNSREVRPFEVYTNHMRVGGARPRFIPVNATTNNETVGIKDIEHSTMNNEQWYSVDGRQLQGEPKTKGVYIQRGKKVVR